MLTKQRAGVQSLVKELDPACLMVQLKKKKRERERERKKEKKRKKKKKTNVVTGSGEIWSKSHSMESLSQAWN